MSEPRVLHRSDRHNWATPSWLFEELDREFGFTCDVCATTDNAKSDRYFTPEMDGLLQPWSGVCWMNPPYGRELPRWIAKASEEARGGATVVALLPARTDTGWWHEFIEGKAEVRFLRGRIAFGAHATRATRPQAPFPSAIVIFRPPHHIGDDAW